MLLRDPAARNRCPLFFVWNAVETFPRGTARGHRRAFSRIRLQRFVFVLILEYINFRITTIKWWHWKRGRLKPSPIIKSNSFPQIEFYAWQQI